MMTSSFSLWNRWRLAAADRLRYSRLAPRAAEFARKLKLIAARGLARRLDLKAEIYRLQLMAGHSCGLARRLRPFVEDPKLAGVWREQKIGWPRFAIQTKPGTISKGVVLKPCLGPAEKGVLLVSFDYNFPPLLEAKDAARLFADYMVIGATAWSPPSLQACWSLAHIPGAEVFLMISHRKDLDWLNRFATGITVIPFLMSHWINPDDYQPRPRDQRRIDILMVANWASFKRHWLLFRALREMRRPELCVVLVGQSERGRTVEHVRQEARWFVVEGQVEFLDRCGIGRVTELQCDSKVALIFSRREGSCVVVAEALFADTPVGMLRGAHIGSAEFINDQTGMFLEESNLAHDLGAFLERSRQCQPRAWAAKNISCQVSTARLNDLLKSHALAHGQTWTRDLCLLGWRPNPRYVRAADAEAMQPVYREMRERHGLIWEGVGI